MALMPSSLSPVADLSRSSPLSLHFSSISGGNSAPPASPEQFASLVWGSKLPSSSPFRSQFSVAGRGSDIPHRAGTSVQAAQHWSFHKESRERRGAEAMGSRAGVLETEELEEVSMERQPMLSKAPYVPPSWATHLHAIPSHFYSLAQLPTPIHRWKLPRLPNGTEIFLKLSGNKIRKLEFLLADAKAQGADCVITIGGIQSNHCRATAIAARYLNMDCYLILRTNWTLVNEDPGLMGNLLVERLVGAHVELVSKEEYIQLGSIVLGDLMLEKLRAKGRNPYLIPVGGSNSLGTWGYVEAVREIEQQLVQGKVEGISAFDDIVMACGSGGTTAGLALGSHLSTIRAKVHAYAVCDDPEYFYDYVQGLLDGLNAGVNSRDIVQVVNAKGLGYALSTTEELKLVQEVSELTGVILDPVYSGKALNGMLKDMTENPAVWEGRKVLFIHTGGLLGMYDKVNQLGPLISNWERLRIPESFLKNGDGCGKMF
ncbi:hypothetical protein O6H91_03G032300 [Diphasiastrum complanatum]|uniref:Uncharacterized protein n=1 Tax=Diphasiastrum complanatum TaxID=34168 RepID=A0ACC2E4Q2_DIPCM|nr:hypothetical protein O6H91_03G032300 [Diphasiastrum complanatum]